MKKNKLFIFLVLCFFMFIPDTFAAEIRGEEVEYNTYPVYKRYYNSSQIAPAPCAGSFHNDTEDKLDTTWVTPSKYERMFVGRDLDGNGTISASEWEIAFCLEIGLSFINDRTAASKPLYSVYYSYYTSLGYSSGNAKTAAEELVKEISLYAKIGSELIASSSGNQRVKYILATQELIWRLISDAGVYDSLWYRDAVNGNSGVCAAFKIGSKFVWVTYNEVTGNPVEYINVESEKQDIKDGIVAYNTLPSICSNTQQINLNPGDAPIVYKDTTGSLKYYNVNCSGGLQCKVDEIANTITVTASSNNGNQSIVIYRKNTLTSVGSVYAYNNGASQKILFDQGVPEMLSCSIGPEIIDKTCSYRYEYVSSRSVSTNVYDMENNLVATESGWMDSNTRILAGTYVGLNITEKQEFEVIVKNIRVSGGTSADQCKKAAIKDALVKANSKKDALFVGGYTVTLPNSNDVSGSGNVTINSTDADIVDCTYYNPAINKHVPSQCRFPVDDNYINAIVGKGSNGVYTAQVNVYYEYQKYKTCINVKTSDVTYGAKSNSVCNTSNQLEVESDTVNGEEHWHYFVPLNSKSNSRLNLKITANTNLARYDTATGNVTVNLPIEQKFYNETLYNNRIKLQGFNFYYKQIDIENPFPNVNMTDLCSNGLSYESLWDEWLLAKCSNKNVSPNLEQSYNTVTYIASDIDADAVRNYTENHPYTSWSNMNKNGTSQYISLYGVIQRNGNQASKVYKLGCGPLNKDKYIGNTLNENALYIKGCI